MPAAAVASTADERDGSSGTDVGGGEMWLDRVAMPPLPSTPTPAGAADGGHVVYHWRLPQQQAPLSAPLAGAGKSPAPVAAGNSSHAAVMDHGAAPSEHLSLDAASAASYPPFARRNASFLAPPRSALGGAAPLTASGAAPLALPRPPTAQSDSSSTEAAERLLSSVVRDLTAAMGVTAGGGAQPPVSDADGGYSEPVSRLSTASADAAVLLRRANDSLNGPLAADIIGRAAAAAEGGAGGASGSGSSTAALARELLRLRSAIATLLAAVESQEAQARQRAEFQDAIENVAVR
jgi:hypothetical protein